MRVFTTVRPFWKQFAIQSVVVGLVFILLTLVLVVTKRIEINGLWFLLLLILLAAFFIDHVQKNHIHSLTFDLEQQKLTLEYFSLFGDNKLVSKSFSSLTFICDHEKRQSQLFIYGFVDKVIMLDQKFRGFTNEQICDIERLIWSLGLPIETNGGKLGFRNY